MNYEKIYKNLYQRAKNRNLKAECIERHHFIPKSIFKYDCKKILENILDIKIDNVDDKINIMSLTCREHYIAHLLLVKIFKNKDKNCYSRLLKPLTMFIGNEKRNSQLYEILRIEKNSYIPVIDKETNEKILIHRDIYHKNKDRYKSLFADYVLVYDKIDKKSKLVSKEEFENNKNRYVGIRKNQVTVIDKETGEKINISSEEYQNNKNKYKTFMNDKVTVYDKIERKRIIITKEEFDNNEDRYEGVAKDTITVLDLKDNTYKRIDKKEFAKLKGKRYIGTTYGKLSVIDKETNQLIQITKEEYNKNKEKYIHPNYGKIKVYDCVENKEKIIKSSEFDKRKHLKLYNMKREIYYFEIDNKYYHLFSFKEIYDFIKTFKILNKEFIKQLKNNDYFEEIELPKKKDHYLMEKYKNFNKLAGIKINRCTYKDFIEKLKNNEIKLKRDENEN